MMTQARGQTHLRRYEAIASLMKTAPCTGGSSQSSHDGTWTVVFALVLALALAFAFASKRA
ncbi:hypothetical protein, partial [Pseudomonas sp. SMV7]|uniref:hypothetical protein n=1 Tax=Pseudomonas sp. SMV7 TaxID=3390194 RepID=UPI003F86A6D7